MPTATLTITCTVICILILNFLPLSEGANVVHRDLKPANILALLACLHGWSAVASTRFVSLAMGLSDAWVSVSQVNKNCDLKICDFGLARGLGNDEAHRKSGFGWPEMGPWPGLSWTGIIEDMQQSVPTRKILPCLLHVEVSHSRIIPETRDPNPETPKPLTRRNTRLFLQPRGLGLHRLMSGVFGRLTYRLVWARAHNHNSDCNTGVATWRLSGIMIPSYTLNPDTFQPWALKFGQDDPTLTDYVVTRWYRAPEACDWEFWGPTWRLSHQLLIPLSPGDHCITCNMRTYELFFPLRPCSKDSHPCFGRRGTWGCFWC